MVYKILFVDDCSTTLLIEQMGYARRSAYQLMMARDGQEAIAKAKAEPPNLILMDATPQNMDVYHEMRKIQELQHVRILMVSSSGEPAKRVSSLNEACQDDRTNPFTWNQLLEMVNACLTGHGIKPEESRSPAHCSCRPRSSKIAK
jgi:DNA-binding response OmpR family regulator